MKTWHWIIFVVGSLALNNWLLIQYLGDPDQTVTKTTTTELKNSDDDKLQQNSNLSGTSANHQDTPEMASEHNLSEEPSQPTASPFESEFKQFSTSKEFQSIMDEYRILANQRSQEKQRYYQSMSSEELFAAYQSAESTLDKQWALQYLRDGKLEQLETYEIKQLYQALDEGTESWNKYAMLNLLLEKGDAEALVWAKESITDPAFGMQGGHEIFESLYEQDPQFVTDFVDGLTLDDLSTYRHSLYGIFNDSKLARVFFENNLDEILDTSNTSNLRYFGHNVEIELSDQQQSGIVDLLESSRKRDREFAIGFVRSIDNIDLLRESYAKISRTQEQQHFLSQLMTDFENEDKKQLARELAENSDDPMIKQMLRNFR